MLLHNQWKIIRKPHFQLQSRTIKNKDASRKPHWRAKMNPEGGVKEASTIIGYNTDEVERFNKWLRKISIVVGQEVGANQGARFLESMNLRITSYFDTDWGIKNSIIKAEARRRRQIRVKKRRDKLLKTRHKEWHHLEDLREAKVFRDQQREARKDRREVFSFAKFLREDREKKRPPYIIEDEETFRKKNYGHAK